MQGSVLPRVTIRNVYFSGQTNVVALQQQQQMQQQLQQQVLALTSSPFGDSPLFRNLTVRITVVTAVAMNI